jgi:hypothetical protein
MANQVRKIAKSDSERGAVIRLRNDDAQLFVDLLQTVWLLLLITLPHC